MLCSIMEVVRNFGRFSYIHEAAAKFCVVGSIGVSSIGCKLFHVVLAVFFAIVGITIGAIAGASIGLKSRGGILHGATVGAIIGSVFSTSILRSYVSSWDSDSDDSSYAWILPWIDSTAILAAKLVHDYYAGALERLGKGSRAEKSVDEPSINLTDEHLVDISGNRLSCSICLQELELAGVTRMLTRCQHTFHADCIGRWFSYHRTCPLCRCLVS